MVVVRAAEARAVEMAVVETAVAKAVEVRAAATVAVD